MASAKNRGILAKFKIFFTPNRISNQWPTLEETNRDRIMRENGPYIPLPFIGDSDDSILRRNTQKLDIAKLEQEREIANANLLAQHKVMIATLITAGVALLSAAIALVISFNNQPPAVNVRPVIEVKK